MPGYTLTLEGTVGRWSVRTATSTYLLDFDARTATRMPADAPDSDAHDVAALRRDTAAIPILEMSPVTVGAPMNLLLNVTGDPEIVTLRQTTPVREIIPLPVPAIGDRA